MASRVYRFMHLCLGVSAGLAYAFALVVRPSSLLRLSIVGMLQIAQDKRSWQREIYIFATVTLVRDTTVSSGLIRTIYRAPVTMAKIEYLKGT